MSDMKAEAYGIFIDGALYVTVESEAAAKAAEKAIAVSADDFDDED